MPADETQSQKLIRIGETRTRNTSDTVHKTESLNEALKFNPYDITLMHL